MTTPPLRVAFLGMEPFGSRPGGLNRYFEALRDALERAGVDAPAIVLGNGGSSSDPQLPSTSDLLPVRLYRYARAAGRLARDVDVVDAHFALYALPALAGSLRRLPLVAHFHGPWAEESRAGGSGVLEAAVKRTIERSVYRRAATVVVLSAAFGRLLVERYGVSPWRIRVIAPGIDQRRFAPGDVRSARARLGLPDDAWVACTVRRLVPRMGLDVLLEAWAALSDEPRTMLLIAGDGPMRRALEATADSLAIRDRVRFLGRLEDERLPDLYRASDVCVLPSTALEGFGLVAVEALACGTPVIGTAVGGLPEALGVLRSELIVPAGDAEALAGRLRGAVEGSRPLPGLDECRRYASRFRWSDAAARHIEIYGSVTQRRRAATRRRVVFLNHCAQLSGAELALLRLLPALDVDAHVILAEDGPLVSRLLQAGISVEVLPMAHSARTIRRDRVVPSLGALACGMQAGAYALRVAARLRRLRPDVVHSNSLRSAIYAGPAARLARVPFIWHLRDRAADDYLPPAAIRLVSQVARRFPDAMIAVSDAALDTLKPALRPETVARSAVVHDVVLPNDSEKRRGATAGGRPFRVGMVGRIAPWKGQDVFLRAFAKAFPSGAEEAVIVGAPLFGETDYDSDIRELGKELAIDDRLDFRGFREDVVAELERMDVLVHASIIPEPFGQVVVEGMAAGLPVVAADAGGPAEVIESGVTGLLYPSSDADALARALGTLAADGETRARIGAAARRRAEDFAPEGIAAEVLRVYDSVLEMP